VQNFEFTIGNNQKGETFTYDQLIIPFLNQRQSKTTYYLVLKTNKPLSQAIDTNKNVFSLSKEFKNSFLNKKTNNKPSYLPVSPINLDRYLITHE